MAPSRAPLKTRRGVHDRHHHSAVAPAPPLAPPREVAPHQPDDGCDCPDRQAASSLLPHLSPMLEALANSEGHYRTLVEQAADGILVTDCHGRVSMANARACELTGYSAQEIVGLDLLETYAPEERDLDRQRTGQMPPGTVEHFERELLRKDGSRRTIEVSVAWLPDGERQSVARDITARRKNEEELRLLATQLEARVTERTRELAEANSELEAANSELAAANRELQNLLREQERLQAELAYRAMHDPMTGLANRIMFGERLDYAMRTSERGVGVVWIDLDKFKEVNDIFGHDVGDEMLIAAADRLREVVRETDDIARMGGDEFAVVLPNVIEAEAELVGERILSALVDKDAFRLQVGASVGVAWQAAGAAHALVLVRRADEAMYRAKSSGGGRSVLY